MTVWNPHLRRVYWETTAGCNLRCIHCRRLDILDQPAKDELTTEEGMALIKDLQSMGRPVLIFSGGEPLYRKDLFELAAYAKNCGLPIALSTNGTLVDKPMAEKIRQVGIYYASVSLDGATAETHDKFRGPGTFEKTLQGMSLLREAGLKVQINFTVTRQNKDQIEQVYALAKESKAAALYLFLLVPVGCGVQIADSQMLSSSEVEEWLKWVCEHDKPGSLPLKAICAPHIYRIEHESLEAPQANPISSDRKGCLAGIHMCFISHKGDVFPCGYLPQAAGNIRQEPFQKIWESATLFRSLRNSDLLEGRCGVCDFKDVCGGCRARGYYATGNVQSEEPYCAYEPAAKTS